MSAPDPISDVTKPAPRKWKTLGARLVTGLLIAVIAFIPLYFGGYVWRGLVVVFAVVALYEWVRMSDSKPTYLAYCIPIFGAIAALHLTYMMGYKAAFILAVSVAAIAGIERIRRGGAIWASLGFLYVIIPATLLVLLRGLDSGVSATGFRNLIYVILIVVAADVGAYFGGSLIGGPKMAPKLSPNKTWAGFVSGLLVACLIGGLATVGYGYSFIYGALFAAPVVVFSVLGDILESAFKRILKVKDTGELLPGHGGVLDRVDSLMMAVVFAAFILYFIPQVWPFT